MLFMKLSFDIVLFLLTTKITRIPMFLKDTETVKMRGQAGSALVSLHLDIEKKPYLEPK